MNNDNTNTDIEQIDEASEKINLEFLNYNTHLLNGEIDDNSIEKVLKWLIYENMDDRPKVLSLYINSIGGDVCSTFGLVDLMRTSKHVIRTIGVGNVMSAATLILSAGTRGHRYVTQNTSVMSHQHSEEFEGKYHDIKSRLAESDMINKRMALILSQNSNLSEKEVKAKLLKSTDVWLTAHQTVQYGIADFIL
jgi:ATP-dependent Clp protease protease subunit